MNIKYFAIIGTIALCTNLSSQNVAINTTGAVANNSAMLDVDATNKGLLIPRVALTATNNNAPIGATITTSLLVYNTATASAGNTAVTPGYYYWDGSQWVRFVTGTLPGPAWMVTGNAGTNSATHFVGTTDVADLVMRTNNVERVRITTTGRVGVNTAIPGYTLDLNTGTFGFGNSNVRTESRDNAGLQGNAGAQSGFFETSAPVNYPAGASSWWHLIDTRHSNNGNNYALQIAGSFFDQNLYFRKTNNNPAQAWSQILTSTSGWMTTGNAGTNATTNFIGTTDNVDFVTRTNNAEIMRVTTAGNVGIGTNAPAVRLSVNGAGINVYATDAWIENNLHVQGNENLSAGGRGRLRVGTAWNYIGLYAEGSSTGVLNDLVLGASSGTTRIGCNGCNTQHLLVNGNLTVNPTANTFSRVIAAGANAYMGIYTDALYNGTANAPTFTWDGMTLSSVGTVFGDISYSSENTGGWHYWMIGATRRMRLDEFNWLMLNGGTFSTTGADVAEEFTHDGTLEEGDVVMINADGDTEIKKCDQPKSSKVFGVISTTPGLVLNSINTNDFDASVQTNKPANSSERSALWANYKAEHKKTHLPVALNGRTPCKVIATTPIKKGDFITSSGEAGYGEKLVGPGAYFAIALEDMPAGSGKIMVAIKNGYTNE